MIVFPVGAIIACQAAITMSATNIRRNREKEEEDTKDYEDEEDCEDENY